jgi:23S rRNA (adenine2030-N6)-methyltransferase
LNYRHVYHAGNFADVLKHIVVILCLDYLQRKEGGLCFVDAHGGAGIYGLASEEAMKTGEWEKGIGSLLGERDLPADLALYVDRVREE